MSNRLEDAFSKAVSASPPDLWPGILAKEVTVELGRPVPGSARRRPVRWALPIGAVVACAAAAGVLVRSADDGRVDTEGPATSLHVSGPNVDETISLRVTPSWLGDGLLRFELQVINGSDGVVGFSPAVGVRHDGEARSCVAGGDEGSYCSTSDDLLIPAVRRIAEPGANGPIEVIDLEDATAGTYTLERLVTLESGEQLTLPAEVVVEPA